MSNPENLSKQLLTLLDKSKYQPEDFQNVRSLLQNGADPNIQESAYPYECPLERALNCWNDHQRMEMVKLLVEHGADVNKQFDLYYPIDKSVSKGDINLVKYLIEKGAQEGLQEALKTAVEKDSIEITEVLIQGGVDVNAFEANNEPYLNYCTEAYRVRDRNKAYEVLPGLKMAQLLIDKGADPCGLEDASSNPMQAAVATDFVELAELFLNNGAKPVAQHETEIPLLAQVQSVEMAQFLLQNGANMNDQAKHNPLKACVRAKNKKLIEFFVRQNIDLYVVDAHNITAFHEAIYSEDVKFLEYLLGYYDIKKCHEIKSVLDMADSPKVLRFLQEKLGIEAKPLPEPIDFLQNHKADEVFLALKKQAEDLKAQMDKAHIFLADRLPPVEYAINQQVVQDLYNQLKENLLLWKEEVKGPIQALYLEYSGDTLSPFDACALFWGYGKCDDQLNFSNPVLAETGDLNLNAFFETIDELQEDFPKQGYEIKLYLGTLSFLSVHLAFHHLVNSADFKVLDCKLPFYVIGCEHDQDKVLIYKKEDLKI